MRVWAESALPASPPSGGLGERKRTAATMPMATTATAPPMYSGIREGASAIGLAIGGREEAVPRRVPLRTAGGPDPRRGGEVLLGTLVLPHFVPEAGFNAELPFTRP